MSGTAIKVVCHYCNSTAVFVDSKVIYKKSYGMIYLCPKCNAYVGVDKGTNKPLGILADAQLRYWKKQAHEHFDSIWKKRYMSRASLYKRLSEELGKKPQDTHIGMFDISDCKLVIEVSKKITLEMEAGNES